MLYDHHFRVSEKHELFQAYFPYKENREAVRAVFRELKNLSGIEANMFLPSDKRISIIPESSDVDKFVTQFTGERKGYKREFKARSEINLLWMKLLKQHNVTITPSLEEIYFLPHKRINDWNIFDFEGKVYVRHTNDLEYDAPDGLIEISNTEYSEAISKSGKCVAVLPFLLADERR